MQTKIEQKMEKDDKGIQKTEINQEYCQWRFNAQSRR